MFALGRAFAVPTDCGDRTASVNYSRSKWAPPGEGHFVRFTIRTETKRRSGPVKGVRAEPFATIRPIELPFPTH